MLRRLIAGSLIAALVLGTSALMVSADNTGVVKGGGAISRAYDGAYGALGVNADADGGVVNVNFFTGDGDLIQHFVGDVTDVAFGGTDGRAAVCGAVRVLHLGTNSNQGMYFVLSVTADGQRVIFGRYADPSSPCTPATNPTYGITVGGNIQVIP